MKSVQWMKENATKEEIGSTDPDPYIDIEELVSDNQNLLTHIPARPRQKLRQPDGLTYGSMPVYLVKRNFIRIQIKRHGQICMNH